MLDVWPFVENRIPARGLVGELIIVEFSRSAWAQDRRPADDSSIL
jgi:hypothetical protein